MMARCKKVEVPAPSGNPGCARNWRGDSMKPKHYFGKSGVASVSAFARRISDASMR